MHGSSSGMGPALVWVHLDWILRLFLIRQDGPTLAWVHIDWILRLFLVEWDGWDGSGMGLQSWANVGWLGCSTWECCLFAGGGAKWCFRADEQTKDVQSEYDTTGTVGLRWPRPVWADLGLWWM